MDPDYMFLASAFEDDEELPHPLAHVSTMPGMQPGKPGDALLQPLSIPPRSFGTEPTVSQPPLARSLSAPNFFADECEFYLGNTRTSSDMSQYSHQHTHEHPHAAMPSLEATHPMHVGPQQWEQFAPYIASPQLSLQPMPNQQQWTSPTPQPTQGPVTTGGLTSCFAAQAMQLPTPTLPSSRAQAAAANTRRSPQDPRVVLDANIKKLKRRGRKLYEEMQAVAVKIQLLERARASYA